MDGFSYTNIFETKGIEYIIIIAFLVILIPFWIVLNRPAVVQRIQNVLKVLSAAVLRIPQGLFYCKNHTWVYLEKTGAAKVGIDDFLLRIVGNVNVKYLISPGDKFNKGEIIGEIMQDGKRLKISSPITGEILNLNTSLMENSGILQDDPYDNGWICTIKPSNWSAETNSYYLAEEATQWIKTEIERFKDFLAVSLSKNSAEPNLVTFQSGGELKQNILEELDSQVWEDFQKAFLS